MELTLSEPTLVGGVSGEPQAWVTALGSLLSLSQAEGGGDESVSLPAEWTALRADVLADTLRCGGVNPRGLGRVVVFVVGEEGASGLSGRC